MKLINKYSSSKDVNVSGWGVEGACARVGALPLPPPHRDVTACVEPGVNDTAETRRAPSSHIAHLYQPTLQEVLANRGFRETLLT